MGFEMTNIVLNSIQSLSWTTLHHGVLCIMPASYSL